MASKRPEVSKPEVEEEIDPVEEMLNRTGCKQPHYALQDCMFENKDWRICQPLVNELKSCMIDYEIRRRAAEDDNKE